MKKIFTSVLLLSSVFLCAQNFTIQVTEGNEQIGAGNNNALIVTIYETDLETVEKEWKSRVKDFNTEKTNLSKHVLFADNAVIKEMGNNTIDIYTTFAEKKEERSVRMVVAFDLGGAYLSSGTHKDKFDVAKKIIYDFAVKLSREGVNEQVKVANKAYDKLLEKQKDLEKDKKDLEADILNYKEKIKAAEEAIKKNDADQLLKKKEIEEQKKAVDAVKKKLEGVK
jgi:hypothetical protein